MPQVDTSQYEFSHGKSPRGRGGWAFFFDGADEPVWFDGTYSEARRQAVRAAKAQGAEHVTVGS